MKTGRLSALTLLVLALAGEASAHVVTGQRLGFVTGLEHPISGLDHVIAMIAVGLWGAQLGRPAIWVLPVTFPIVMAFGGFLALIGGRLPAADVAIALSGLILGGLVLVEARTPLLLAAMVVGVFGLFHGYAHGVELTPGADATLYSLGFVIATGLLHATGITLGIVQRWRWGRLALRVAGAVIMTMGAGFVWSAVA